MKRAAFRSRGSSESDVPVPDTFRLARSFRSCADQSLDGRLPGPISRKPTSVLPVAGEEFQRLPATSQKPTSGPEQFRVARPVDVARRS
jgi:hypothetical protein